MKINTPVTFNRDGTVKNAVGVQCCQVYPRECAGSVAAARRRIDRQRMIADAENYLTPGTSLTPGACAIAAALCDQLDEWGNE